jgi:NAD(P)-dependent dehydrogenase (short-subunit alcohol dehydrogenase family)
MIVSKPGFNDLEGKTAIITGGAGVLCSSLARALGASGVNLALLDIDGQAAEDAASRLIEGNARAIGIECDVLSRPSLDQAGEAVQKELGPADILINGAGGNVKSATTNVEKLLDLSQLEESFYGLEMDGFRRAFDLNFMGTLLPTQVLSRPMAERRRGVIVNISSMGAYRPLSKIPAYSAAKAAISNLTEWLAIHLAPAGIRVNAIAPGFFLTEQLKFLAFDENGNLTPRYEKVLANTAMGRLGEPDELQGAVLFLVSELSSFVTGTVIPVDGGFNANSGV